MAKLGKIVGVLVAGMWLFPATALADEKEREGGGGGSGCHEVEKGGHCEDNDLSPSFQDSPVDRSFNPTICVLPDSCHFHEAPQDEPASQEEQEPQ